GAGVRMAYVDISELENTNAPVISMFGVAPQLGVIVKPEETQWRIGVTTRAPVSAGPFTLKSLINEERTDGTVIRRAGASFILPNRIVEPWEIEAGLAYQLGPRPLNPRWIDSIDHRNELIRVVHERRLARAASQRAEIA